MAQFPVEGLTELTEDDLEAMREKARLNPVENSKKYGFIPSKLDLKHGVHMIPAFDANYFQPGTIVATYMDGYHERIALICGYENGLQIMKLNEPWPSNECRPYTISLDDYLNGRVTIKRLVKEDDHD